MSSTSSASLTCSQRGWSLSFLSPEFNGDSQLTKPGVITTLRLLFARQAKGKRKLVLRRFNVNCSTARLPNGQRVMVRLIVFEETVSVSQLAPWSVLRPFHGKCHLTLSE